MSERKLDVVDRIVADFGAFDLRPCLAALGYVGSISHGTHAPDVIDDTDLMGIVVPPSSHLIGLGQWQHWVYQRDELDVVLYSSEKMVRLLLKSNPNVLGYLWLRPDHYVQRSPWLDRLISERDTFASKAAYHSFAGYAHAQLDRMEKGAFRGYMGEKRKAMVAQYGYDTKNAAHLIRLLRMACEFLATGEMQVYREHDGAELYAIKMGAWSLEKVKAEAATLFECARDAKNASPLPEQPDVIRAERLLMSMHLDALHSPALAA